MSARTTGYSQTPLARKLGIGVGTRLFVKNAPPDYLELLAPLPPDVECVTKPTRTTDVVHLFTDSLAVLTRELQSLRIAIKPNAAVWVSWPKKASKVTTDITEDRIRELALPIGFVDVKVCAVNEIWSGLKLVIRKELR